MCLHCFVLRKYRNQWDGVIPGHRKCNSYLVVGSRISIFRSTWLPHLKPRKHLDQFVQIWEAGELCHALYMMVMIANPLVYNSPIFNIFSSKLPWSWCFFIAIKCSEDRTWYQWPISVTGLTMLLFGEIQKTLGTWARKVMIAMWPF